ncbi:MAG: hypothetical protein FJ276_20835 [Planctomycetes bacterium]|nr:hypothetical protein [Planctomycetota bacterium]
MPRIIEKTPEVARCVWEVRNGYSRPHGLLVAGPRRLYDENDIIQRLPAPDARQEIETQQRLRETQADLLVIDAADGSVREQTSLDFAPVWDGLAVAEQSLFVSDCSGALSRMNRMKAEELDR